MKVLFQTSQDDTAAWLDALHRALPEAQLRAWQPGDTAPADAAIVWRPPREMLAGREGLRAIFNLGAGVDAILALEHAHPGTLPRDALLVRLEDGGMAAQMIEYASYAALRYLRRFDEYERQRAERRWRVLEPHAREQFTVGVLGLGALGGAVARALAALGLPVRGYSRTPRELEGVACYAGEAQFDAFLEGVKLLVNLLPHTAQTDGILNARTFARLAPGAYLVNLARGAHLVEQDLLDALESGRLAAASLDVFQHEPLPPDHPFWRHPRIDITPHSAAITLIEPAAAQIAGKLRALMKGEAIGGVVAFARGY